MGKLAIIKILHGNFQQGFEVSLEIKKDNGQSLTEIAGRLPENNEIEHLYNSWQHSFAHLTESYRNNDGWDIDESIATNISTSNLVTDCRQKVRLLEKNMQTWLQRPSGNGWQKIRERLSQEIALNPNNIRLIIKSKNSKLWKFPWHVWDLLVDYPDVGLGYSLNEHHQVYSIAKKHHKVRILAIFGDSNKIDLTKDRKAIDGLQDAEVVFLQQPNSRELIQQLRCDRGWNILFFAGHSCSEIDTGRIYINERESLTVEQFQNALQEAISNGLKIAIFNSCDGLGIAKKSVADLHIPAVIAMQELVPDIVAQSFLKDFLIEYQTGHSLYTAVRRAQSRLEEFTDIPGVTWLPLIVQNASVIPPNWSDFFPVISRDENTQNIQGITKKKLTQVILSSMAIASLVTGVRWFGVLQPLELYAYDRLMQLRSGEAKRDPRILVITIDNSDIEYQERKKWKDKDAVQSLSDKALSELLNKLQQLNPTSIGLDIYRPNGFEVTLANRLQNSNNLFTICKTKTTEDPGVSPPQNVKNVFWGFSDVLQDEDKVVRRHLLTMNPDGDDPCKTQYSLSLLLAIHYLSERENITPKLTSASRLQIDPLVFEKKDSNKVAFKKLSNHSNGYQAIDDRGFQILLNYRYHSSFEEVFHKTSLQKILTDLDKISDLKSKLKQPIIIIGTTAKSEKYDDFFNTPYGQEIPGVFLQAQMVSQILSKVLDNRPLLWWWSNWIEVIWISGWSIIGGLLAIYLTSKSNLILNVIGNSIVIFSICMIVLGYGGWIPLIPPILALFINSLYVHKTISSTSRINNNNE